METPFIFGECREKPSSVQKRWIKVLGSVDKLMTKKDERIVVVTISIVT
jgi:hypothetical protein